MSGICGIVRLDGGKVRPADVAAMTGVLERRGPDGTRAWTGESAALGHTLLATTPEALVEQLPLTDPDSGCTITADARLDNREELIADLGLENAGRVIGDGELILRAYLRWGEDCPKHLLGDFAFAIWDARSQQLFCARDHMGMRQLIYHHAAGRHFTFATETEAVLANPAVPRRINEGRVADYIDDLEGLDLTSTFFEQVHRLPPAHWLRATENGCSSRRYWELQPPTPLKLPNDEAYAQAFRDVFTEAIRCRLRALAPIGAMLSGGVDSSSVVAVASRLLAEMGIGPLRTFSAVGPDPASCVETRAIAALLGMPGIAPATIDHSALAPFEAELKARTQEIAEPFDGHMTLIRAVYIAARRAGVKVVFDGVGGDVALGASNRISANLLRFRFAQAWREARGEQRFWKNDWRPVRTMISAAWTAYAPTALRRLRRYLKPDPSERDLGTPGHMTLALAARVQRPKRWQRFRAHMNLRRRHDAWARALAITHPHLTVGRERYDREAGRIGIEPRDPFMDVRLIRFCLSLPEEQLQEDGWPKLILRRAMGGLVPEDVLWRRGKEHLGWRFTEALHADWPGWADLPGSDELDLGRFIGDIQTVQNRCRPSWTPESLFLLLRAFWLACWLKRNERPVVDIDSDARGA